MNTETLCQHAIEIFNAGVDSVRPHKAVGRGDVRVFLEDVVASANRVFVLGFGKAGAAMARALEDVYDLDVADSAVIIPRAYLDELPAEMKPHGIVLLPGGHPKPTDEGVESARRLMQIASSAEEGDAVIVLISGGGSALLADFAEGISLEDAKETYRHLLASGASISEVNMVRKHLSGVSGGRLAAVIHPARSLSLMISDVPGDDPAVIASGPTVADPSTYENALDVVRKFDLEEKLPQSVAEHLRAGVDGKRDESVKPDDERLERAEYLLVASNRNALDGAAAKARDLGYDVDSITENLDGEASEIGRDIGRRVAGAGVRRNTCWLLGGETTVTLGDSDGKGGRNQELALAAAFEIGEADVACAVLSGGTDGIDGPTDAAGAVTSSDTINEMKAACLDPSDHLARHDSYPLFQMFGGLVRTGPTHTNAMDVVVALKRARE